MSDKPNNLIETARVPDPEVMALQQQLNARTRAGTLSGPPLPENGHRDAALNMRQREQEAYDAIALAKILPQKPTSQGEWASAKAHDEAVLASVFGELQHIGDTTYLDHDHKKPTLERLRRLEAAFQAKWDESQGAATAINDALRRPPKPGELTMTDGSFNYRLLEGALSNLATAERALDGVSKSTPVYGSLENRIAYFRQAIVAGLQAERRGEELPPEEGSIDPPKAASPSLAPAIPLAPPESPDPAPTPIPTAAGTAPLPAPPRTASGRLDDGRFVPDPAREKEARELDMMGPERRGQLVREAIAKDPHDPLVGRIAASLVRTHPETATGNLAEHLDGYAMRDLGRDEARLGRIPPQARLAMVAAIANHEGGGEDDEGVSLFAGALVATLLRQHPAAANEVLAATTGAHRTKTALELLMRLGDDEIAKCPKEALHSLAKHFQTTNGSDERRAMSRVLRLMNKR